MNSTTKFKKDGSPKLSGGNRKNSGAKMKTTPEGWVTWPQQLDMLLRVAAHNKGTLPKGYLTKSECKKVYGHKAYEEYSHWFISLKDFDDEKAAKYRLDQSKGKFNKPPASWKTEANDFYTPDKYVNWMIKHKCLSWKNSIKFEHKGELYLKYADIGKIMPNL